MSNFFKNLEQPSNLLDAQAFEANRRGEITAAQQKQITAGSGWGRMIFLVLLVIIGILSIAILAVFLAERSSLSIISFIIGVFIFLLMIGYSIWNQARKALKLRRDIANHAIRQGQGQLAHGRKGYVFEMSSSSLHLPGYLSNGLLPGITYQVYYLEESGFLLSATTGYQNTPFQMQAALNEILASANSFSADDLYANQNGTITFAQRSKLIPNMLFGGGIIIGSLLFMIPLTLSVVSSDTKMPLLFALLMIALIAILPITGLSMLIKSLRDALLSKPEEMQGIAVKEQRIVGSGKNRHVEYNYLFDKRRFNVTQERFNVRYRAYTALIDGEKYRIYYLPRSRKLISIEVLNSPCST